MITRNACPMCRSTRFKKNGHTRHGQQNHHCKACNRQFGATAKNRTILYEQRTLIERLFCERLSLRGICRAVGVSLTWLLHFMVERCAACPDHLHVELPAGPTAVVIQRLEAEADEIWSFVGKKAKKQWIWIVMDTQTRQVIAFHIGDRSRKSGEQLWAKIPETYKLECPWIVCTDLDTSLCKDIGEGHVKTAGDRWPSISATNPLHAG